MDASDELGAPRIVVVDDDEMFLRSVERQLRAERWDIATFASAEAAMASLDQTGGADVLLTDIHLTGKSGLDLLKTVRGRFPSLTPILMTGDAAMDSALEALRNGAYDYLVKPFEPNSLLHTLRRAVERSRLLDRNLYIQHRLDVAERAEGLVGGSAKMRDVFTLIATVAPTDATVLLLGESGTGKELVARSVHRQSSRVAQPFIGINCGALSETVLESELFGHVRGAFTGAVHARRGLFEAASGGTLFLDEVGELTATTQVRLLRVLQEGEVRPVGSNQTVPVDVRIIAATNRDLSAEVQAGRFRRDLYYRLEVITIALPPLRERMEDLTPLVHHLVQKRAMGLKKKIASIDGAAMDALARYSWPGNVRELENVLERALVMTQGETLTLEALPDHFRSAAPPRPSPARSPVKPLAEARAAFDRTYILGILERSGGNVSEAARLAGLDPSNLRRLMKRLGVDAPSGESAPS